MIDFLHPYFVCLENEDELFLERDRRLEKGKKQVEGANKKVKVERKQRKKSEKKAEDWVEGMEKRKPKGQKNSSKEKKPKAETVVRKKVSVRKSNKVRDLKQFDKFFAGSRQYRKKN